MNKMNHLGGLIGVSLVSLEMQMVSVKGYDCLPPRPLVFPGVTATRVAPRPHNRISVSGPNGDGERRHIFLRLIKDGEKANGRKGRGCPLCTAAVNQDFPDPTTTATPTLLIPAGGSVTALISQVLRWLQNQVTAARRCACDKRASSPMHKHTQAYFCSHAVCRSQTNC